MSQNKMPPDRYSQMIKHLTRKKIKNPFTPASAIQRQKKILEIYNRVFKRQKKMSQCATCVQSLVTELLILLKTYE